MKRDALMSFLEASTTQIPPKEPASEKTEVTEKADEDCGRPYFMKTKFT